MSFKRGAAAARRAVYLDFGMFLRVQMAIGTARMFVWVVYLLFGCRAANISRCWTRFMKDGFPVIGFSQASEEASKHPVVSTNARCRQIILAGCAGDA